MDGDWSPPEIGSFCSPHCSALWGLVLSVLCFWPLAEGETQHFCVFFGVMKADTCYVGQFSIRPHSTQIVTQTRKVRTCKWPQSCPRGAHLIPIYTRVGIYSGRFWISLEVGHLSLLFVMESLGALISSASVCKDQRDATFCDQHRTAGSQGGFPYTLTCCHSCGSSVGISAHTIASGCRVSWWELVTCCPPWSLRSVYGQPRGFPGVSQASHFSGQLNLLEGWGRAPVSSSSRNPFSHESPLAIFCLAHGLDKGDFVCITSHQTLSSGSLGFGTWGCFSAC